MKAQPPIWENFPAKLAEVPHWVLWGPKGKAPKSPSGKPVSITSCVAGWPLSKVRQAFEAGGFSGVGFVLRGTGVVGVDLDDCVQTGRPSQAAMQVIDELGAKYVEFSPSGTGLRAFGTCEHSAGLPGRRFRHRGVATELYTTGRYLTVTGRILPRTDTGTALGPMPGFARLLQRGADRSTDSTEDAEVTEAAEATDDSEEMEVSQASGATPLIEIETAFPPSFMPTDQGMRHDAVFQLARYLKGLMPNGSEKELHAAVARWHSQVLPVIGTKDFGVTWAEFVVAWERVKFPLGRDYLAEVLNALPEQLPSWMQAHRFGPSGERLLKICVGLAQMHAPDPFFLGCRKAGELIGCHETRAAALLKAMVATGYLELECLGVGTRASRYRLGTAPRAVFSGH